MLKPALPVDYSKRNGVAAAASGLRSGKAGGNQENYFPNAGKNKKMPTGGRRKT